LELLDQFVPGPMTAEAIQDVSMAFKKALIERALGAEMSHHLGYRAGATKPEGADNHRNGSSGQDGADRGRPAAHRGAARPGGQLRAATHPQA
jgi:transposase-like protein